MKQELLLIKQFGFRINQKKFVEESTREILIVTRDGCYTYQTHNENQLIVSKLKDVREILDSGLQSLQPGIIQPGQSATGTPNQNQGGMPQMNPNDQKALEMFQISNVSEMFRPIQLKYTYKQKCFKTNQQQMNQQRQGFTKFTPPFSTDRQKVSPQAFLVNGQNAFSNQQATPIQSIKPFFDIFLFQIHFECQTFRITLLLGTFTLNSSKCKCKELPLNSSLTPDISQCSPCKIWYLQASKTSQEVISQLWARHSPRLAISRTSQIEVQVLTLFLTRIKIRHPHSSRCTWFKGTKEQANL